MSHCDLCGVSLGSDPEAYRCGETMTCVRHLQDNLQQEWSSNKNNVANYQLQVEELQAKLAEAEALLREAVAACRREFLQTTGPNTEWYDATRLMRDWFERARTAGEG